MNRQAIIITSAVAVAVITGAVLLFIFAPERPTSVEHQQVFGGAKSQVGVRAGEEVVEKATEKVAPEAPSGVGGGEKTVKIEIFGTIIQLPAFATELLRPVSSFVSIVSVPKKGGPYEKEPINQLAISVSKTPLQTQQLSDKVFFDILYPPFYIAGLKDIQTQLIAEGAVVKESTLTTEDEIRSLLSATISYLADRDFITQAERFETGKDLDSFFNRSDEEKLREIQDVINASKKPPAMDFKFPNRREALKEFYETVKLKDNVPPEALQFYPFIEENPEVSVCPANSIEKPRVLAAALLRGLMLFERFFSIPSAVAVCGPTYCVRPELCFLEGTEAQKGGSDFFTPCCYGRICGVPIGCYELCGDGSKPFIWDPKTQICGCGTGGVQGADIETF